MSPSLKARFLREHLGANGGEAFQSLRVLGQAQAMTEPEERNKGEAQLDPK